MYFCEFCNYSTIRKNDFEEHNRTDKHKEIMAFLLFMVSKRIYKPIRSSTNEHKEHKCQKR